ncbi:MAG: hypothetical protein J3Q66DRAFT_435024 [Benniella sp.]|nr:MAG: hypothetical protein J3Q66DRAFT_435024 [Benniella sp.]
MTTTPCRFFLAGNCRNGASCRFYHEGFDSLPPEMLAEAIASSDDDEETTTTTTTTTSQIRAGAASSSSRPSFTTPRPCHWYMAGYCHRGESCWFSHDRSHVNPAQRGNGESTTLSDNEATTTTTEVNRSTTTYNSDDEEDQKCAICFEVPTTFGLLVSCNHAFCLTCIRTWRSKEVSADLQPVDRDNISVTKACPNCRTPSLYVVPSSYFPSCAEQKEIIIQNYREATARKPCKYFKESGDRHWCRFGDDCHFAHLDENGEPCKVNPESDPRLRQRRRGGRHRSSARATMVSWELDENLHAFASELLRLQSDTNHLSESWTEAMRQLRNRFYITDDPVDTDDDDEHEHDDLDHGNFHGDWSSTVYHDDWYPSGHDDEDDHEDDYEDYDWDDDSEEEALYSWGN